MTIRDKFEEMKEHHEGRKEYRHELREERKLERELKHDAKEEIKEVTKKELPILLVVTTMFSLSIISHYIGRTPDSFILSRSDGVLFIFFFLLFIFYIVSVVKSKQGFFEYNKPQFNIMTSILLIVGCTFGIILASDLVVNNAKVLAEALNVSTKFITMTVVVIGTSLPEMTMTVVASKKGEFDIALGNIIGTNIFNIGIVLGLPLLIYGGFSSVSFTLIDILAVQLAASILYLFARNDKVLSRKEGIIMILLFCLYYGYMLIF